MRRAKLSTRLTVCFALVVGTLLANSSVGHEAATDGEQFLLIDGEIGRCGGKLTVSQRSEPKTLNPALALEASSRQIIGLMQADLIHINRLSQKTEPSLASSWTVSPDGRRYRLQLRQGVRFSDGQPFDADDVLFTFRVYLDEQTHSPQRDLLIVSGKPIKLRKIDRYTVEFELEQPYAAAERLFDSIAILPSHLLASSYEAGKLSEQWSLAAAPAQVAGLGPFRLKSYVPGQRITLERNPYYWKKDAKGTRLPYLDEITAAFTGNAEAEAMRFQLAEIDVVSRLSAVNFSVLQKHEQSGRFRLYDLGPSLEYNFLFFNLNGLESKEDPTLRQEQTWFRQVAFRRAVSAAIDREALARLAYHGRACPLATSVTPGNKLWIDRSIPQPARSLAQARQFLEQAGFSWSKGSLVDGEGRKITFSIVFNAANPQHTEIATLIQADLKEIGIDVKAVPMEFRALLHRVFKTYEYEAAIMALVSGDADPNSDMNVWALNGGAHVWNLASTGSPTPWEKEIDHLMQEQMTTLTYEERKRLYDRVQQLVWEDLPLICLVSPDVLVGAANRVGNFHPAILSDYTLWNAEQLFSR